MLLLLAQGYPEFRNAVARFGGVRDPGEEIDVAAFAYRNGINIKRTAVFFLDDIAVEDRALVSVSGGGNVVRDEVEVFKALGFPHGGAAFARETLAVHVDGGAGQIKERAAVGVERK